MASWQAHFFSFLLRHTFKRQLAASAGSIEGIRKVMNGGMFRTPADVRIREERVGQTNGEWVTPAGSGNPDVLLLYLHGGGYIACSPKTHRPYTTFFAKNGFLVYAPDYRLAPEHRFPAGLDDAVAAYKALQRLHPGMTIVIAGDSAGGGLALATMLQLRDESGVSLPAAAVLFSPLTDLTGSGASRSRNDKRCAMFHGEGLKLVNNYYLRDGEDPANPLVSPLYADLRGLPPMLIHVGADETLLDDSTALAERAKQAGVQVQINVWPAVPHVWQMFVQMMPEARASLRAAASFLQNPAAG